MQRINVHTYPVRYAASEHPGARVVLTADPDGLVHPCGFRARPAAGWMADRGRERAAYSRTWRNRSWVHLTDGISAMVRSGLRCWLDSRHPGEAFRGLNSRPAARLETGDAGRSVAVRCPDGPRVSDAELLELREAMRAASRTGRLHLPFAA